MKTLVQRVCLGDARDVSYVTNAERLSPLRLELTLIRIIIDRASSTVCDPPFVLNRFPDIVNTKATLCLRRLRPLCRVHARAHDMPLRKNPLLINKPLREVLT